MKHLLNLRKTATAMKYIIFSILISLSVSSFSQQIQFKKLKQNFGFVHEGDTVKLSYELKNTGNKSLVITDYEVECGCTVMQKPSAPIEPGNSYTLEVTFDTHEKYDRQDRTIKVISNAINSPSVLRFKGVVLKAKEGRSEPKK
ncbi:MAG: hypothetical protein K0Q95_3284 [Bacteroidota bacterium]|jgi:hypothetical protein|nr:hypothetical protein [Bacteroidota bacterium]